ncbi:MAG TPA: hypothetical protein ACFCUC_14180 [Desulfobacterales bacterium]
MGAVFGALLLLLAAHPVSAAPCDVKNNPPPFIQQDLTDSYCELCGYGYITVIISNPYREVDMTDMSVRVDLRNPDLTYTDAPGVPNPITYRVNGGAAQSGFGPPDFEGGDSRILLFTEDQIPALDRLVRENGNDVSTIEIRFAVTRVADPEDLIDDDRRIQTRLVYSTEGDEGAVCLPDPKTVSTPLEELPLREPRPEVSKQGRNIDADQGSYSSEVFGNVNDDIIWRIRVYNGGTAGLQDLHFDDLMDSGNLKINYICPSEDAAEQIANNDGAGPGSMGCIDIRSLNNDIDDFDVDSPFGDPPADIVDARPGRNADIYLVGKIPESPNGSCSPIRANRVSNIEWGCEGAGSAGGITRTSTGYTPPPAEATLSTFSDNDGNQLRIQTDIIGANTSDPAGSKATVRVTIRNRTGGTVKGIRLRNILPPQYVVDPTYTPRINATGAYGFYEGLTDRIEWTNPVEDTFPPATNDPAKFLANTAPEFRLYSSTVHDDHPDQFDMLRHNDRLVINFRIVLIRPDSYDRVADLDVRTEAPDSDPAGTDPDNAISLTNELYVDFEDFCDPGVIKQPGDYPIVTTHASNPEDLDINISGSELVFILTGDPNQRLPLTVNLRNSGGHEADDYSAYITFGRTMEVVSVPSGCATTTNPPPHDEWRLPAPIPSDAVVYECTGPAIRPAQTVPFTFEVIKSSDPDDLAADDLTFRADVVGEITLSDGTPLWFPTPINPRSDEGIDDANNYSLDGIRARVVGFNLLKSQEGLCSENPPAGLPDLQVQIGEECSYEIETGGWFGFDTPGFLIIAVQNIAVTDQLPEGQGFISSTDPDIDSTDGILGITRAPAGLSPLDEGSIEWSFNRDPATERITTLDEWFKVDKIVTRLLNDPLDLSDPPNRHAASSVNTLVSTFQAVFQSEPANPEDDPVEVIYDLGPGTVGYPRVEVRRVNLTVTEPDITVVKEVCNESLYGAGTSCSNFVPLADDGDAYDSYIYRLTVTNRDSSDGVPHAPAYDVTVTDVLDASDLAEVALFGSDGLDNDGDGVVDEADEGTISDNTVKNGLPAELTFSYTHSAPLLRIDPDQSVRLYYRVDYDDDAAPLQIFTNAASATYDSLEGPSGSQTVVPQPNSTPGGARFYTSESASAVVQIIPVVAQPKRIAALSNTPLAVAPDIQGVSIGEEIEYRLHTLLPVARLRNFVIKDTLPAGLRCIHAPAVNLDAAPYDAAGFEPGGTITPTCSGNVVEWDFGDQRLTRGTADDRFDFDIGFIARVENTADTNENDTIANGSPATEATVSYVDDDDALVVLEFGRVDVVVGEPRIDLTKAFAVAAADAADVLTVTVTAENTGTAPAYNLRVLDDLSGLNLTFTGTVGGPDTPDIVDTAVFGPNQPIFGWTPPNGIAPGDAIEFTFNVRVDNEVQPLEVLDNTLQADWTSLPGQDIALNPSGFIGSDGAPDGMRIGALPHAGDAVNDYETGAAAQTEVPAVTLVKSDLDPGVVPTIGAHKRFQIEIRLPEGLTQNVAATDSLDSGTVSYRLADSGGYDITYTFEGIELINDQPPTESALIDTPADGASGSIVWEIGRVLTDRENDPSQSAVAPLIRIQYYARVNNDLATNDGETLQNAVTVNYTHGETGATETLSDNTAAAPVVEPLLAVVKEVRNVTSGKLPDDPPSGGDLLEYRVTVLNSGTATAHDVNLVDTLPGQLTLYSGFTPTALINGSTVAGFASTPGGAPDGPLVWGRDNGDESLDIPVAQSLVLTYRVVVLEVGGDLSNRVWVDWTSLNGADDGERNGQGCPSWTAPNDYCVGPAVATIATVDDNSITKDVFADTFDSPLPNTSVDAVARVGDIITYRLALNLSGGLTRNLRVQDALPGGMAFADIVSINGDATPAYAPPASGPGSNFAYAPIPAANVPAVGQTGTLTWIIGDVINDPFGDPTTDTLEIFYRARILPDNGIAHVATTSLSNTAEMDYETAAGPAPTQTDSATVTLLQPLLAVAKSAVAAGGDTVLGADEIVTYTVEIENSGGGPAYDTVLTDILPVGMRNGAATITMVAVRLLAGGALPNLAPVYDAASGLATWDFDTGTADTYTIPAGDTLQIVYQVQTDTSLGAGLTLANQAQVQRYYSFDDDNVPTRDDVVGERQSYGPGNTASVAFTTDTPDALVKANPAVSTAAVGEPFTYTITVPATLSETALHDVRILDDLGASAADLTFVGVVRISGALPWTPVNTGTAKNLVIEDTANGIDIPANTQIEIAITVVLDDTATNVSGLQFNNAAGYTYDQIDDDSGSQQTGGSDTTGNMTVVGPDTLILDKSGPATMQVGTPATFTLTVDNTSTGTIWNPTILDRLPDDPAGGMCGAGPSNVTAQLDGSALVPDTDFSVEFLGEPACEWRFQLLSPAGGIPAGEQLVVTYEVALDPSSRNGIVLTNVAGAARWYSADPESTGTTPRIYERDVDNGTPGTVDHQDDHSITTEAPILSFLMSVENLTTGQYPGRDAAPGDTLRYTIQVDNSGPVGLSAFSITEELDRLNAAPAFIPGSLVLVSAPSGADTSGTDAFGGVQGTGLLDVGNLTIDPQGGVDDAVTVVFDAALAPVITSGTVVLGQAELALSNPESIDSDDPDLPGDEDPTETRIASAPVFQVQKISTVLSGDPNFLMAGETLRYTLTIRNIGDEDAVDVRLRDDIPAHTAYVSNSTTLNGLSVADPSPGVSPLITGILVNAPENTTPGYLRADATPGATNAATVTFDVVVDPSAMNGLVIENQGFVGGSGAGSGLQPEQPSDDPTTPIPDDPTRNVVGNQPLLYAHKTVTIEEDFLTTGIVDPGDVLRYRIVIYNFGAIPATGVVLTDAVPTNTGYVADSLRLNGSAVGGGAAFPLDAGLEVQSSDNPGDGIISAGSSAEITFTVVVDNVAPGTLITNQGSVTSGELPPEPTDADGLPSNGDQPTVVVVGDVQLLSITKEVQVVGGGVAAAGGQLEYVIRVTNIGSLPSTNVLVTDDLNPLAGQVDYVAGSGTLNGAAAGVSFSGGELRADYEAAYGPLPPGAAAVVRFRVQIDSGLAIGTSITNTGQVVWDSPLSPRTAGVSLDVGGTPGSGALNGSVWHDANLDLLLDAGGETGMEGWTVELYRGGLPVATTLTDAGGGYRLGGLLPNEGTADLYEIRFFAPGAGANTASLGTADSPFTNGPQQISAITVASGGNLQNLNLPLWPNGAVYDSVARVPVAGARLVLRNAATGVAVPGSCFDDPNQQNQITTGNGFYKFDLNFSDGACPAGGAYLIDVTSPGNGYMPAPSQIIPPASDASTPPFSIPACPGSAEDAVPATAEYCEVTPFATIPPVSVAPDSPDTIHHLHLILDNGLLPGTSQVFNNPIALDPELGGAVAITKTTSMLNVTRGSLVPYTITVSNVFGAPLYDIRIVDRFPAGFKYMADSARLDGSPLEPSINGLELTWDDLDLQVNQQYTLQLLLVVGSGVSEGEYVNRAQVIDPATGSALSGEATATVEVIPDPDFDCTDVIGKVFDDRDLDGWQDSGEAGLAGVRVVTVRGLIATTDEHGRFHITCAAVPDEDRGGNLILKLDERSLPTGYRLTTENPRVQRATRGKMLRFNFGATIHRVVRMDVADGVFETDTTKVRLQWASRIDQLLAELKKAPSILRLSYLADVERESLVRRRLDALRETISRQWERSDENYRLTIETEIFWRRGAPVAGH